MEPIREAITGSEHLEKAARCFIFFFFVTAEMDGASLVAVVTTNWPFARIRNDFSSAAAVRGTGTLAGSEPLM